MSKKQVVINVCKRLSLGIEPGDTQRKFENEVIDHCILNEQMGHDAFWTRREQGPTPLQDFARKQAGIWFRQYSLFRSEASVSTKTKKGGKRNVKA